MNTDTQPARTSRLAPASKTPLERFARSPKGSLTFLFVPLLVIATAAAGWQMALPHVLVAVAAACLTDFVAVRLTQRVWAWPTSALLSGLIVAFVLGVDEPWAVTAATAALATVSKHLVRTRRGHIFNPAALALVVSDLAFRSGQSWWGSLPDLPWPALLLLFAGGAWLIDRLNKFPLVLAFLATSVGLFTFAGLVDPVRVAEMFRAPFVNATLFLACFMLTDPPTSPGRVADQLWVGALVAIVSAVAQLLGVGQSYLLVGLLAGNFALVAWRLASASLLVRPSPGRQHAANRQSAIPVRSETKARLVETAT